MHLEPYLRRSLAFLLLGVALAVDAPARASGVEGSWETPLGTVKLQQAGEELVGELTEEAKLCGFAKGSTVLRGRVSDGLFTGEVRVCYPQRCDAPEGWVLVLAEPVEGKRLIGAVASAKSCADAVFKGKPFVLHRPSPPARPREAQGGEAPEVVDAVAVASSAPRAKRTMRPKVADHFNAGNELVQQGYFEAARKRFVQADKLDPNNPEILTQIGVTYYARNELGTAEQYYRRALLADGDFVDAHYNLACVLARQDRLRDAIRSLRQAVEHGFSAVEGMDADSDLTQVRGDPAYTEIRNAAKRNARRSAR